MRAGSQLGHQEGCQDCTLRPRAMVNVPSPIARILALPGWLLMAGGWAHRFLLDAQASMPPDTEPRRSCNCKASFPSTDTRRRVRGHHTRARGLKQPFPSTDTRRRVRGHQTRLAPLPIQDHGPQAGRCLLRRPHRVRVKTQTSFMVLERDGLVPLFTLVTKTY